MSQFYKKGRMAAQRGEPREANPYVQPYARREWFDGWDTANEEMTEAANTDWSRV
jgi:ribosome modulation factor